MNRFAARSAFVPFVPSVPSIPPGLARAAPLRKGLPVRAAAPSSDPVVPDDPLPVPGRPRGVRPKNRAARSPAPNRANPASRPGVIRSAASEAGRARSRRRGAARAPSTAAQAAAHVPHAVTPRAVAGRRIGLADRRRAEILPARRGFAAARTGQRLVAFVDAAARLEGAAARARIVVKGHGGFRDTGGKGGSTGNAKRVPGISASHALPTGPRAPWRERPMPACREDGQNGRRHRPRATGLTEWFDTRRRLSWAAKRPKESWKN